MLHATETKNTLVYVMRVKLPSSSGFASCPSGDTDYDEAYRNAILENLPDGFEVAWTTRALWPVDRDGLTWVKLYCRDEGAGMKYWMAEANRLGKELTRIKELAKQI